MTDSFLEAKRTKRITIYTDTPETVSRSVEAYNREMAECRRKKKKLQLLEEAYFITNPVIAGVFSASEAEKVFAKPLLGAAILLVCAAAFIFFTLAKKNYLAAAVSSALMMILDIRFGILLIFNVSIAVPHYLLDKKLRPHDGYPVFVDIQMIFERGTKPQE